MSTNEQALREAAGIERAAAWIETRRNDYMHEHGSYDPETGGTDLPNAGQEYVGELEEIAEGLRALLPCYRPPAGWMCTRPRGHVGPCAALATSAPAAPVAAEVPRGYVHASETMDVDSLHRELVDLTAEAVAVDTVIGRPEVFVRRLMTMRDALGRAVNGRIPFSPVAPSPISTSLSLAAAATASVQGAPVAAEAPLPTGLPHDLNDVAAMVAALRAAPASRVSAPIAANFKLGEKE